MEPQSTLGPKKLFSQNSNPGLGALAARPTMRPLSDIRELTETSLYEGPVRETSARQTRTLRQDERGLGRGDHQAGSIRKRRPRSKSEQSKSERKHNSPVKGTENTVDRSSIYSIPLASIPPRSSSRPREMHDIRQKRSVSIPREPAVLLPPPRGPFHCIANSGQSQSPVRDVVSRMQQTDSDRAARVPSKTIVKIENPSSDSLLDTPVVQHPRLKVDLLVAAPLFVGGSSVEGTVRIVVDQAERVRHRKTLTLERLSIDLLGVEEVSGSDLKRHVFLALGNELVDLSHPPPFDMVESQEPPAPLERSWILVPSISTLPFLLKLPLNVGPPPFHSRHARIRYVLCATLTIKDAGRQLCVRCSQDTALLSVSDPEKALISLPSPLTASEEFSVSRTNDEHIIVTAGLHRQVWVSGTNLFADVHIVNNSRKTVRKLELRLERIVLCYRHAAAATLETSASNARMFDFKEHFTATKKVIRPGVQGWNGVLPSSTVLRTCELEIPRGHATIHCHKFFEVRYYLYIVAYTTRRKVATVQLPIHIIHMNSLDVPTNSVAQVAAAIEEKRDARSRSRAQTPRLAPKSSQVSLQGRAFSAPRKQSLDRARARYVDLQSLTRELDSSPKKSLIRREHTVRRVGSSFSFKTPPSNRKGRVFRDADADELRRRLNHRRQASMGSNVTNRSVPRSRHPQRNSSALGFYLQEVESVRPNDVEDHRRRRSVGSCKSSRIASLESGRPRWTHEKGGRA